MNENCYLTLKALIDGLNSNDNVQEAIADAGLGPVFVSAFELIEVYRVNRGDKL